MTRFHIRNAAGTLAAGGVALYPTEGVWGLGCDPLNADAVLRILELKRRPIDKGLVLIASDVELLSRYLATNDIAEQLRRQSAADQPTTWVVPAAPWVPVWLTGGRDTLAVRITRHPVAAALSAALGTPLVSTSANVAGRPAPTRRFGVSHDLFAGVDVRVGGQLGALGHATPIIDLMSGQALRAG